MAKEDYFDLIEELSAVVLELVGAACSDISSARGQRKPTELKSDFDRLMCTVEKRLFSDFIPPMQREDIARAAHALSRVEERAYFVASSSRERSAILRYGGEGIRNICVSLANRLHETALAMRRLRSPSCIPALEEYRLELCKGRELISELILHVKRGALPKYILDGVEAIRDLLYAFSDCFDSFIEIMLNNI